jgi:Tfp pilus assembly protein PilO
MKPEEKKKPALSFNMAEIKGVILNFVVPLIASGISLALLIIIVFPYFKNLPVIKEDLNRKLQLQRVLTDKITNLNRLVDFKTVVDEDSNLVNQVLVNESEVPRLLDEVNQIATNAGMDITRLSYSFGGSGTSDIGEAKQVSYNSVSVALGADSSYEQLVVFMKSIENAARFLSVPNFRYSSNKNDKGETKLGGSFSIDSPYLLVQSSAVTDEPVDLDISSQTFVDFINKIKGLKYYEFLNPNIEVVKTETLTSGSQPSGAKASTSVPTQ